MYRKEDMHKYGPVIALLTTQVHYCDCGDVTDLENRSLLRADTQVALAVILTRINSRSS